MIKVFRFLVMCTISVAFASIASAQTYKQVDCPWCAIATDTKRRAQSAGHERRWLYRHIWCHSWFHVNGERRIHVVRSSGLHIHPTQLHQVRRELSWAHTWIRRLVPSATVSF